jgi:hypothetical protein
MDAVSKDLEEYKQLILLLQRNAFSSGWRRTAES